MGWDVTADRTEKPACTKVPHCSSPPRSILFWPMSTERFAGSLLRSAAGAKPPVTAPESDTEGPEDSISSTTWYVTELALMLGSHATSIVTTCHQLPSAPLAPTPMDSYSPPSARGEYSCTVAQSPRRVENGFPV
jgi:hypothetical protein